MRLLFLLVFLAGAALGLGYPWLVNQYGAHDIAMLRVYDAPTGFQPIVTKLAAADAPVKVTIDVTAVPPQSLVAGQSVLTITAATGGRTVLAETLDLAEAVVRDDTPQTPQQIFALDAGEIATVADGDYTFTVGPGDAEGVDLIAVDLLLSGAAGAYDERAQPIGFSMMAIGFILLVLSFRRGATPPAGNPNSQPPPPRWGRGGSQ
jgi:hypothetical protein